MRKNLLLNINLGLPKRFDKIFKMKLRKFQVESVLGHLQGGNYEFKIAVWTNTEKYSKKDYVMKHKFLNKLRRNIVSIKSQFV